MYNVEFVPEMRLLGYDWKLAPTNGKARQEEVQQEDVDDMDCTPCSEEEEEVEDTSKGSKATWYRGRRMALLAKARDEIGSDAPPSS